MPRKRRLAKLRRHVAPSPALRHYLETGEYRNASVPFEFETFLIAGATLQGHYDRIRALWHEHGEAIASAWIDEHPGTRPFAWWVVQAPAPRRCLRDPGRHLHGSQPGESWWRPRRGIPAFDQVGHFTIAFESEAAYLDRLGLLGVEERAGLSSDAFSPDVAEVDVETYDELVRGRERGGPSR